MTWSSRRWPSRPKPFAVTGRDRLLCWSMGFLSRRRGGRPRVIALVGFGLLVATTFTPGSSALARTAPAVSAEPGPPSPLAHAPPFRRAFGAPTLAGPDGVAADPVGDIWVADTGHDRIAEFSVRAPDGHLRSEPGPAGRHRHRRGGHIWVADTGRDQIVEFSPAGRVLAGFGSPGAAAASWTSRSRSRSPTASCTSPTRATAGSRSSPPPVPTAVRSASRPRPASRWTPRATSGCPAPVYADGNTIDEFSPAGQRLTSFGTTQAGYGDLGDTGGIAIGPGGKIYVAQPDYGWITVFGRNGDFVTEFGLRSGALQNPQSLARHRRAGSVRRGQRHQPGRGVRPGRRRLPALPGAPRLPGAPLVIVLALLAALLAAAGWRGTWCRGAVPRPRHSLRTSQPGAGLRPP